MIEHAGGMMRRHRCDTDRNRGGNGKHADGLEMIHHEIDPVAGLFRRDEITPLGLLDRDEDVMAVLIFRFPVVAQLAYASTMSNLRARWRKKMRVVFQG